MQRRKPDTTIPCDRCNGSGQATVLTNQKTVYRHECGACFGTGLSTNYYDQRRNGTTITAWDGEPAPAVLSDPTVQIHSRTATTRSAGSGSMRYNQQGTIMLVSWQNREYRGQ